MSLELTAEGGRQMGELTQRMVNESLTSGEPAQLAIALDQDIQSAPTVQDTLGQNISISNDGLPGGLPEDEAKQLETVLNTGALPVNMQVISQTTVGPTLGLSSLKSGLLASLVGFGLVLLLLFVIYRALGIVADLALLIYAFLLWGLIVIIPITVTLPGIAGIVLSIGVAADANVVIFERIKEEIRRGKTPRSAIQAGYDKGFRAILDGNVTTLITAFILFALSSGSVRGFAVLLAIGVVLSMFTAIVITRALLGLLSDRGIHLSPALMGVSKSQYLCDATAGQGEVGVFEKVDFVGGWKLYFSISAVLLLAGIIAIALGGLNFGIDFQGGAQFTVANAERQLSDEQVRAALPEDMAGESVVTTLGENGYEVRTPVVSSQQEQSQIRDSLSQAFGGEVSVTTVSPAFGEQLRNQALQAVVAALIVIVAFISFRFEFAFALAAMAALVHDILMTIGFYAIVGREVSLVTVVAVLTVLGYSIYDTIIIFDRIRENSPTVGYNRRRFDEMINRSIRQVVRRSIYTSIFSLIPIVALLIFGEATLSDFAFALLVGIAAGTYSSIFIASPVLSLYKAWRAGKLQAARST